MVRAKKQVSDEEWVSRSQRKRDSTALQELGAALTALSSAELLRMPLSPDLREAVVQWARISSHEGRRRQMQYIGRLMREQDDVAALTAALAGRNEAHAAQNRALKRIETLREALLKAEDPSALCAAYAERADEIRELVLRARAEREAGRPPHAFRALFKALQEMESRNGA